ncbi:hypothetical protein SSX86_028657 [Deinandra increscens subsp. villosa]|uniref:Maternal effect embryo arrest 22 n=1 Tax=Deinandra increscens subsp. villosa TaxID=3103831 RepID=A0AAP0CEV3_9ASTR
MAGHSDLKVEPTKNPCCSEWEHKFKKSQLKVKKTEDARAALKKAVGIYEQQFDKMQDERSKLKKAYDELKLQTDDERKGKEKESAARVSMENEISALKAEILSLNKKGGPVAENASEELILYKGRVFDKEKEINCLLEEKKRAEAEKSRTEQELSNIKTRLINVETEKKKLMQDLQIEIARADSEKKRAGEMLKTAEAKQAEVEVLKAEKKNKNNDLCLLKSEHQNLETEIGRLKELLENEKKRADCETKKAESEKKKAHKMKDMLEAEQSRVDEKSSTEQELSNLKTQLLNVETEKKKLLQDLQKETARADLEKKRADELLTKQAEVELLKAEEKNNDLCLLKSEHQNLETEIGRLKELLENEKKRADCETKKAESEKKKAHKLKEKLNAKQSRVDEKSIAEQELSNLKTQLVNVDTEKKKLMQDLQKEIIRADSEKKRADEMLEAAKTKQAEVEVLKAEKKNNDLCLLKSEHQNLETEVGRLKGLLENERKRADCESKKAETEKKNAHRVKEMLKAEQSKTDEQRKLVDVERKKTEEFALKLERSKCEADEAKSKLVSEGLKFKEANKKLEAEMKKIIKEKKKAVEQQKIAEKSTKHALEEKHNASLLQQQLEDCQNKYDRLKKDMEVYETNMKIHGQVKQKTNLAVNGAELDKGKEIEIKKAAEMYKLQAMKEKSRADKLAQQLEDAKQRTKDEHKVIEDLVSSKNLTDTMKANSSEMKLLKKRLKLEKERVKHFIQVAEHEKRCKNTVEEELHRLKLEFARFSSRVGLCSCFNISNVGNSCLEKVRFRSFPVLTVDDHMNRKRKFMQTGSGKELAKPTKPCEYLKPNIDISTPSLPISGTCTESTSGTASKMEPLGNRKNLNSFALVSSMASFSDRQLVVGTQENLQLPISRLSSENAEVADTNVKSPLKVRNKDGNIKKRKRHLNPIESIEHLCTEGKIWHAKLAKYTSELHGMLGDTDKPLAIEHNKEGRRTAEDENIDFNAMEKTCNDKPLAIEHNKEGRRTAEDENVAFNALEKPCSDKPLAIEHNKEGRRTAEDENVAFNALEKPCNDKPLANEHNKEGIRTVEDQNCDSHALEKTCNDDLESFKSMFDGDCMKLLNFDSEAEEERYRVAVERPLSPTLPNVGFESNLMDLDASRSSESEIPIIAIESWSIVVFPDITDSGSLSKIFHMTKTFSSLCCELSQSDLVIKNVISTLSADEILSPKEKVCVFFSLFLKSFSSIALTNFNHVIDGNFLSSIHTFSGKLKKVMSDLETRTNFEKVCALEELITLIQSFLINGEILVCSNDTSSETLSLPDSKASVNELVVGAVLLASVCEAFDRVDFICEISYTISRITSSSTLTLLHVFAYVCEEKLLHHGDYTFIMTVIKSLVTYSERENLSSDFSSCGKCPFSIGAISMLELTSLLLKKLSECSIQMYGMATHKSLTGPDDNLSDLGDVLSLLELLATKMSWGWVCKNIVTELLKMLETCVREAPLTSIFILLGQMARLGIDANGFEDVEVESIRVKLISFISQGTSNKFSLPVQFAAVNALLGSTPLGFQEICTNNLELPPPVGFATATDCIQRWFLSLSDEHKSLSVRLLTADAS